MTLALREFFWTTEQWTLRGSASVSFAQTGNLKASGALAGTATITFAQTGLAVGAGSISGTATAQFSQTGALGGAGALAGTNGFTFAQTGALAGAGALAGNNGITFVQTGAIAGAGALAGTVGAVFGETGALTANGALAGSTTLIFGQSGDLQGGAAGAIQGTAAILFAQTGQLTGVGALAGQNGFTFGQSGILIDASAPIQTTGGGLAKHQPLFHTAYNPKKLDEALLKVYAAKQAIRQARTPRVRNRKLEVAENVSREVLALLPVEAPSYYDMTNIIAQLQAMTAGQVNFMQARQAMLTQMDLIAEELLALDAIERQEHEDDDIMLLIMGQFV